MASAAEQMAANISLSSFGKATELKKRLWFTVGALVVFRVGAYIPVPGVDPQALAEIRRILGPMHEAVAGLAALPVPVLASVQGAAAGAGLSLAFGADLAIAAEEARFGSDFLDRSRAADGWLGELVEAAAASSVPFVLGGHALVSDGLRILVDAAWQGH